MNATTAKLVIETVFGYGSAAAPPYYGMLDAKPHSSYTGLVEAINGGPLPTFIDDKVMYNKPPESAGKIARDARKRKVKPTVPTEGEEWTAIRDKSVIEEASRREREQRAKQQRADLMEIASMQLAVYCRVNSIDDAECQRIADRINYEHSPKNHLRNPRKLKSSMDVVIAKVRKIRSTRAEATIRKFQEDLAKHQ